MEAPWALDSTLGNETNIALDSKQKNNLKSKNIGTYNGVITSTNLRKQATHKCNKHKKQHKRKG
jgi:hypothetical protein